MRLRGWQRFIRFMFIPICMLAVNGVFHYLPIYSQINQWCQQRATCLTSCIIDNFPNAECLPKKDISITYNEDTYNSLFFYPKSSTKSYQNCLDTVNQLPDFPYDPFNPTRQLAVHVCFPSCTKPADCLTGFGQDNRPHCTPSTSQSGLYCVDPAETCENFKEVGQVCYDSLNNVCVNWLYVLYALIITNVLQVIFEGSMLFALEISLRPNYLDKLAEPDNITEEEQQDQQNQENKKEPDCYVVLNKCFGELLFITLYTVAILLLIVTLIYQIQLGKVYSVLLEFGLCIAFDQLKSIPAQALIYWVVVRRLGSLPISPEFNNKWDDDVIFAGGIELSLWAFLRKKMTDFLEIKQVGQLILGMTIFLCCCIFSELALDAYISTVPMLGEFYYGLNFFLLQFFITEIIFKTFAYGVAFYQDLINCFDSSIVIVSYVMLILDLKLKILGLLRVLRLIKVIVGMKKVVDEKRARSNEIKQQKKESSSMASYVERVIDFLEKHTVNPEVPKHLQEDIQWAIDIISSNKLYIGNLEGFKLSEERPEVKAWTDLISMKNIPVNKKELERLRLFEIQLNEENLNARKRIVLKKQTTAESVKSKKNKDDSKKDVRPAGAQPQGEPKPKGYVSLVDSEVDSEFLVMLDLMDMEIEHLEMALDRIDMTTFDAFHFDQILNDASLPFLVYKIFQFHNLFKFANINLESLVTFTKEMAQGYFKENPFHNVMHILDSLQGLHFVIKAPNIKKNLKRQDQLSAFIACLMHDYEHPGYSNQFVIRTKHPLAIRYSDQSVLENHHLAAAFQVMFSTPKCNIIENMSLDLQKEARSMIIQTVLNTDISKHFSLITELKTKLGNNFPTETMEDRVLILSVSLRVADNFKMVRERSTFFKWMENMFDEFFKQGDMEKVLELPISKFMDRENTNKEKAFSNYINVVCKPLFVTYLILVNDQDISDQIYKEGIEKNKKSLETRIDDSGNK